MAQNETNNIMVSEISEDSSSVMPDVIESDIIDAELTITEGYDVNITEETIN